AASLCPLLLSSPPPLPRHRHFLLLNAAAISPSSSSLARPDLSAARGPASICASVATTMIMPPQPRRVGGRQELRLDPVPYELNLRDGRPRRDGRQGRHGARKCRRRGQEVLELAVGAAAH
ncbi:unnamed protein product, partial [Urochloa humidicola]